MQLQPQVLSEQISSRANSGGRPTMKGTNLCWGQRAARLRGGLRTSNCSPDWPEAKGYPPRGTLDKAIWLLAIGMNMDCDKAWWSYCLRVDCDFLVANFQLLRALIFIFWERHDRWEQRNIFKLISSCY